MQQAAIILMLNTWMAGSDFLIKIIPILADIFVFSYPLYLIYLYFFSHENIVRWRRLGHRYTDRRYKYNALTILFSFIGSIGINYIIKSFIQQPRPYQILELPINPQESLILNNIPTDSFPSDHAAVGMTIAITTLILGYKNRDKKTIIIGRVLLCFALIMDVSRITIGVHRPVDILAGAVIGAIVAMIINHKAVQNIFARYLFDPIISFQERLFKIVRK